MSVTHAFADPADVLRRTSAAAASAVGLGWLADALTDPGTTPEVPGFLSGGRFYPVRTLTADDSAMLHQFLQHGLSDQSRLYRFCTATPQVPVSAADWLARRDGRDRVALIACAPEDPATIAGMVEYALGGPSPDPEVAFAVADAYQGRGIATQLLRMLATLSLAGGYNRWYASVLSDNTAALATLRTVGKVHATHDGAGSLDVTVTVDPATVLGA